MILSGADTQPGRQVMQAKDQNSTPSGSLISFRVGLRGEAHSERFSLPPSTTLAELCCLACQRDAFKKFDPKLLLISDGYFKVWDRSKTLSELGVKEGDGLYQSLAAAPVDLRLNDKMAHVSIGDDPVLLARCTEIWVRFKTHGNYSDYPLVPFQEEFSVSYPVTDIEFSRAIQNELKRRGVWKAGKGLWGAAGGPDADRQAIVFGNLHRGHMEDSPLEGPVLSLRSLCIDLLGKYCYHVIVKETM